MVLAAIGKAFLCFRREDEALGEGKDRTFGLDNYDIHARNYFALAPSPVGTGYYRGMPLGVGKDGVSIYTSAREIGNMGAGIVARKSGLSWKVARFGFDLYQSRNTLRYHPVMNPYGAGGFLTLKWQPEGISTQNAERFGYNHPIRIK